MSRRHFPYDFEKIDRFFSGAVSQFDLYAGILQADDIMDIVVVQKYSGGAAQFTLLVVDVADIQHIEKKSVTAGRPGVGDLAEKNDGLRTAALAEGVGFRQFSDAAYDDLDSSRNRHPDDRLVEKIGCHLIICNDNA